VGRISGEQDHGSCAARYGRLGEPTLPIFFSKKRYRATSAIDFEKHLLQCPRLFFEKLAMAAGSFEK
jgi:hypothetical protein